MTAIAPAAADATKVPAAAPPLRRVVIIALAVPAVIAVALFVRSLGADTEYRTPMWAIWLHLATVVPAVPLGAWLLWRRRKGDFAHRIGGCVWAMMMFVTAIDSFWIRTVTGTIGPIHIFSLIVLVQLPRAVWMARSGQIDRHVRTMRGLYVGLIAAGFFAMAPGRMLWSLVFG